MSNLLETAKKMTLAFSEKNCEAFAECVHEDYSFTGPMMEMNSKQEALDFMKDCPFQAVHDNCEVVVEGQRLVHIFDWNVTAPFEAIIPMVEVMDFEGNLIKKARLYYDTALFPENVMAD